jgi:predicted DNA-binding transcriptional regulator AlpA
MTNADETLIPVADAEALGLGIGRRSIGRRIKDDPQFPPALRIRGRLYVRKSDLENYKTRLISAALAEPRGRQNYEAA